MSIDQLRALVAVADAGGISAAADRLDASQPAVSRLLDRLERKVGEPLLVRRGRGVVLTAFGSQLAGRARSAVMAYDEALRADDQEELQHPLRIAGVEPLTTFVAGAAIAAIAGSRTAEFIERLPGELELALVDHQADIALTMQPVPHDALQFDAIATWSFRAYGAAELTRVPIHDLDWTAPFTRTMSGPLASGRADGWPPDVPRRVKYRVSALETALQIASTASAAVLLPELVAQRFNEARPVKKRLVQLAMPFAIPRQRVYVVTRRDEALADLVRQALVVAASPRR